MDLTPVDIVGKRCYHFIHAEDVEGIRHCHLDCKYTSLAKNDAALTIAMLNIYYVHSTAMYFVSLVCFGNDQM